KARILTEKKLQAELERLNVGLSNSRELLRFQDDLADARSKELSAIIDYNKSLAEVERTKGTILKSNNISLQDYN
ncbi:MAG TPA: TolC family protein, partial [Nitrospiria bacterium]|nr:TolC family protein [Nitrospiria bacterium]